MGGIHKRRHQSGNLSNDYFINKADLVMFTKRREGQNFTKTDGRGTI